MQPRIDMAIARARDGEFEIRLTQFIIEERLPFAIATKSTYCKLIEAAKHLPVGYQHPGEHTVSNKLVPAECSLVEAGVDKIHANMGDTKGAVAADGATVLHHPLLAAMVLLPDLAPTSRTPRTPPNTSLLVGRRTC